MVYNWPGRNKILDHQLVINGRSLKIHIWKIIKSSLLKKKKNSKKYPSKLNPNNLNYTKFESFGCVLGFYLFFSSFLFFFFSPFLFFWVVVGWLIWYTLKTHKVHGLSAFTNHMYILFFFVPDHICTLNVTTSCF